MRATAMLSALTISVAACAARPATAPESAPVADFAPESGSVRITIRQRSSEPVPGFHGRLRIDIDDVTGGQVLVRVDWLDQVVVPRRSMRVGDAVEFAVGGASYTLGLAVLVNRLLSEDHAVFEFGSRDAVATVQIAALLDKLETSKLTFVRNGEDFDGRAAAAHLRAKLAATAEPLTADEFLERVATASSTTGEPYLVRIGSATVPLADWLRGWSRELMLDGLTPPPRSR